MRSDSERRTIKELGFRRWCSEVLFYHYKWHIIGTIAAILVIVILLTMNSRIPDNDATVVLVVSENLTGPMMNDLKVEIGRITGDVNGDGQVVINLLQYLVNPRDGIYDNTVTGNATTVLTSFLNDDMVLYLFDKTNLKVYNADGRFNEQVAAEYGGVSGAIALEELPFFRQMERTGENALYACFKTQPFTSSKSETEFYALARTIVAGLLEGGAVAQ